MGTVAENLARSREEAKATNDVWGSFRAAYPQIETLLCGRLNEKGGFDVWPMTLMVYKQGAKLKWNFNCKQTGETIFGCFPDTVPVLDDVEQHLAEEKYEIRGKGR